MLTENDAVEVKTTEEVTAPDVAAADVPTPADEAETVEQLVDDKAADSSLAAMPETDNALETSDASETQAETEAGLESDKSDALPEAGTQEEDESQLAAQPEQKKPRRKKKRRPDPAVAQAVSWFAACGRCSFFLAGYKVVGGEGALETAVSNTDAHWMTLPWNYEVANLVHKSYGSRMDIHCYHYEGRCQECHRCFVYHAAEEEGRTPTFRIELKT